MPDRESVITHLQIIRTWAEFARERDLQFFTPKHLEDIVQWSDDALALLKEQEAKTGKWILDDEDANSWECSECGGLLLINDGTPHENDWCFCPYCGSKLEEQAVIE